MPISNVPICTQGMQQTWWPEAGIIIVTGPYSYNGKQCYSAQKQVPVLNTYVCVVGLVAAYHHKYSGIRLSPTCEQAATYSAIKKDTR